MEFKLSGRRETSETAARPQNRRAGEAASSAEKAMMAFQAIAGYTHENAEDNPVSEAGKRLSESILRLEQAVSRARQKPSAVTAENLRGESAFDESKLLATIEKWQRRYEEIRKERDTLRQSLEGMEEECGRLLAARETLKREVDDAHRWQGELTKNTRHVAAGLNKAIALIDTLLGEESHEKT